MRQHRAQLLPQPPLRDEPRPHRQPAVRRQALVRKTDPHRLHPVFGAQIQPHRLVRRPFDGFSRFMLHTINDAKRCASWRLPPQLHEPGSVRLACPKQPPITLRLSQLWGGTVFGMAVPSEARPSRLTGPATLKLRRASFAFAALRSANYDSMAIGRPQSQPLDHAVPGPSNTRRSPNFGVDPSFAGHPSPSLRFGEGWRRGRDSNPR